MLVSVLLILIVSLFGEKSDYFLPISYMTDSATVQAYPPSPWYPLPGNKHNPDDCDRWYICVKGGHGINEELAVTIPNLGTRTKDPTSEPWNEEAIAKHIVKCANAHDKLLDACEQVLYWFDAHRPEIETRKQWMNFLSEAILKAKGEATTDHFYTKNIKGNSDQIIDCDNCGHRFTIGEAMYLPKEGEDVLCKDCIKK